MTKYRYYTVHNSVKNEEEKTPLLSEEQLEIYLTENPHLGFPEDKASDLGSPGLHSGRPMSGYKTNGYFKEKLQSLKRWYPRNTINVD